jgi:4-hydroxy-tetrahydrodipicolinate synthase
MAEECAMLGRPFNGVIAAAFLPMHDGGEIDWRTLEQYMDWLARQRPDGIAMNMDASEVIGLSEAEQDEVVSVCRRAIGGRTAFLSGLVAGSTLAAARRAEKLGFPVFPPFPTFSGAPVPGEMIYRFHKAIADAAHKPIVCFQFPKGWGPDYTPQILQRMAEIPELVAIKEASFDVAQTLSTIEAAGRLDKPIGVLTGSDTFIFEAMTMGCSGALIGFAGSFTRDLVQMNTCVRDGRLTEAQSIWRKLGPIARYCWRPPIRDFRPRMKEVLRLQEHLPSAACREPQLGVDADERAEIARLMRQQGLLG